MAAKLEQYQSEGLNNINVIGNSNKSSTLSKTRIQLHETTMSETTIQLLGYDYTHDSALATI